MPCVSYRAAAAAGVLAALLASAPATAQWLGYPTAHVPRKADGKVDMTAPAPRLANGKPDFSGIWISDRTEPGQDTISDTSSLPSGRHMANMGVDFEGGLPYQPWQLPIVKRRTENLAIEDPHIRCLPDFFLRAYGLPHMLKFVHTPDLLVMLNEMNAGYRQVFTDARALPDTPAPSWQGYSSAKWDGDTLVVDTIGMRDDTWIDWNGSVVTEAAKIREEIRRLDTKPWTVTLRQRVVVDAELIDEVCLENEQFVKRMGLDGAPKE
jgi:hypothetical protein